MNRSAGGLAFFLLLTFTLTWAIALGPLRSVLSPGYYTVILGLMFIPGFSALFVRLVVERVSFRDAGLRWGGGRWWLVAWLGVAVLVWAAVGLSARLGQADFDRGLFRLMTAFQLQSPEATQPPAAAVVVGLLLLSLTVGTLLYSVVGFGQEFGWRGYLLMRLLPMGRIPAIVLTGVIWGLWYAPLIPRGYDFLDFRIALLLKVGFCLLFGVILGWLRLASGSVVIAAVAHGAFLCQSVVARTFLRSHNDLTSGLEGLIGQAALLLLIGVLWLRGAFKKHLALAPDEDCNKNLAVPGEDDAEESLPEQVGE